MNVIFLDFDGVLDTYHYQSNEDVEAKIKILAEICHEFNCKVVIEAAAKDAIDEETMETQSKWVNFIFSLFKKYKIECIGRTPNVEKRYSPSCSRQMWKEDEIRLYLLKHPEIKHYCIIDDDDLMPYESDLNKVRDHLLTTIDYSKIKEEEGLLIEHKEEIGKILEKENEIRRLILKNNYKNR